MNTQPYRVLVTGSRNWQDIGADIMAKVWALTTSTTACTDDRELITEEPHPAAWHLHGRKAGPLRNQHMVAKGADICLAFIRNGSRGATGCADLAEAAGITTKRWTT